MSTRPSDLLPALRGGRAIILVILFVMVLAAIGRGLTAAYVEILWQGQAGYAPVFWRRVVWEWGVRIIAGVFVGALVYGNLRVASSTLGGIQIRRRFGNLEISEQLPPHFVAWSMLTAATFLGLWFGASIPAGVGRQLLLAVSAPSWGATDPILGRDLGFYVFWFPVLASVITYAMIVAFLVFTLATAGYAATGAVTWTRGRVVTQDVARVHLGGILATFFLLLAGRLWLGRYDLLLNGNSAVEGIFGFADAQARLPAMQTLTVISVGAAIATVYGSWKNRPWPIIGAFAAVMLGSILIGNFYPSFIQSFRVEPNELVRESPYIEHSLEFTRRGFGLNALDRRSFEYVPEADIDWAFARDQFAGLPVWGTGPLLTTFRELEALYPYYDFDRVAIDRYPTPDGPLPVAISVRQIARSGIQDPNWQNLHLRELFVAGMGSVVSLAATRSAGGRPQMVLRGIPPRPAQAFADILPLTLERPEVFYGTRAQGGRPEQDYAVVTPGPEQYLAPDSTVGRAGIDFPEGIQLTSTLRTALLAWRFGEANLLFSSELTDESRLIHRRQVTERALAIAPFLRFPEAAYPVVSDGRVVWVLEGFTGTLSFPLSRAHTFGAIRRSVSYVRNSVKVTIDAVTGDVAFYRVPIEDPLADAYDAAYPGLLRPISEMPADLREHLRYPRSLLDVQSRVLLQFHQETAPEFHGQEDVWNEPEELSASTSPVPYEAEYGIYRLPGEDEARFQLTTLFVPAGRENLTAILIARTDESGVPETILMNVPVDDQVAGPRQLEAQVEQDPIISQQLSLWRTGGSEVWTGHLHLVPVGNRLLYMEPVFLAAEEDAIPELRRVVVSDGRVVVMTETLEEAIVQLAGLDGGTVPQPLVANRPEAGPEQLMLPAAALTLLERAEARARAGDWQGFGEALEELRALLQSAQGGGD